MAKADALELFQNRVRYVQFLRQLAVFETIDSETTLNVVGFDSVHRIANLINVADAGSSNIT